MIDTFLDALLVGGDGAGMTVRVEKNQRTVAVADVNSQHVDTFKYRRVEFTSDDQDTTVILFVPDNVPYGERATFALRELIESYQSVPR